MHNLIINKLYIFSTSEKKAKIVSFKSGKNIITSQGKILLLQVEQMEIKKVNL